MEEIEFAKVITSRTREEKKSPCHYLNKPNELRIENRSYSENRLG